MTYRTTTYDTEADILAGVNGLRSPIHRTIDITKITADADGDKYLPAGMFYSDSTDGYCRPLPRAKVTADTGTGTAVIPVSLAFPFIPGDLIRSLVPFGTVTIASSGAGWVANDTITITIAGQAFVYTVVAEDIGGSLVITNTNIAAKIVLLLTLQASRLVTATSTAGLITLQSADEHTLSASDTGANGTATASGAALTGGQTVGTVASVNVAAKTITLTANNATALVAGMSVGTPVRAIGMMVQGILANDWMPEQGLYTGASVRIELFPYYDVLIKVGLPGIQPA